MSKELDFLESMKDCLTPNGDIFEHTKKYKDIRKALQRLEAIDNAKPSEALELVYLIKDYFSNMIPYQDWINDIEKYILKAQEQEKVLEIIWTRKVDMVYLKDSKTVSEYNSHYGVVVCKLTQEEFDLLKRYAE